MSAPARERRTLVQRALAGHAAIGLLAGALIYIVCLSGTIAVTHDRLARWEQAGAPEMTALPPDAARAAMAAALATERDKPRTGHLYIQMPTAELPRASVTTDNGTWMLDGAGRITGRDGAAWTEFVVALHEYLNLPALLGLILVGMLGVVLTALAVTGIVAHPRIFRDAFRLRTRHDSQIARADWHNRLGVWTLPFAVAIALTGAFIGLGSIGATVLAKSYAGGDVEKVYATIFGDEPPANPSPAPLPDIGRALVMLAARVPQARPTYVVVHDPGTAGQHVQIIAEHPRRLIYGETYAFDAQGHWRGSVGLADGPLGKQFAASTYNLHFGNYGGLPIEIAYLLLGLALCVVTSTGTSLWLQKRERRGQESVRLRACWTVIVWGVPLALVGVLWLRALAGPTAPLAATFWGALVAGIAVGAFKPAWISRARFRLACFLSVVATASIHVVALNPQAGSIVAIDAIAILAALASVVALEPWPRRTQAYFKDRA